MKKIKILWVQKFYDHDGYLDKEVVRGVEPDSFDEISDEDFNLLKKYLYVLKVPHYDWSPKIVVLDDTPPLSHLETIKAYLKMESEKKALQEKKKEALALKKKKDAAAKKKALFETLKKEFEK